MPGNDRETGQVPRCACCGEAIPSRVRADGRIVYFGTVGRWAPDVPEEHDGLCAACLAADIPTPHEAMAELSTALQRLGDVSRVLSEACDDDR